jgi:eukaryotic-like serine/threonine-protein kinase
MRIHSPFRLILHETRVRARKARIRVYTIDLLNTWTTWLPAVQTPARSSEPRRGASDMIGTEIGNYRVLEKIGEGGMGVVYKAIDVNLDRTVAIKALKTDLSGNPDLEQRFRVEIKALANLNHTNLTPLYALFMETGRPMMVLEFVEGETFEQMVRRRGPIPGEEAISLFRQALAGIGFAHRMGIVHRDIKPANIMLNPQGVVKVMDCGIAKALSAPGAAKSGVQIGTPLYMSPEQFLNRSVDVRSDIYSLGVTLYELLTGKVPFSGDSDYQIMADHVNTPPPLPTSIFPYVPKSVERAVLKALEKSPEARYQSVEEFAAALDGTPAVVVPAPVVSTVPSAAPSAVPAATVTAVVAPLPLAASAASAGPAKTAATSVYRLERKVLAAGLIALLALAGFVFAAFPGAREFVERRLAHGSNLPAESAANSQIPAAVPSATPTAPAQPDANSPPPDAGAPAVGTAVVPGVAVVPVQPGIAVAPAQPDNTAPADNSADQGPVVIPAGTVVAIRLSDPVDSSMNQVGDKFSASVDGAVNVNGTEAIPAGADASVSLIHLAIAPIAEQTDVQLQLVSLSINGTDYTPRSSIFEKQSIERTKKKMIAGAAVGAAIGGIFGHGHGAADGAASGAAKPYQIVIPAQTRIKFTLRRSITLSQ